MKLDNNNHSVFGMYYYLALGTKYRRKAIYHSISVRLREIFDHIANNYNISVVKWNENQCHVHILCKAQPSSGLSKSINAYKSASSRLIKKEYSEIKTK